MSATQTDERPETRPVNEDGTLTHVVEKEDWERGYILGEEITALCGFKWVPTKDPNKYPPCPACLKFLESE